MTRKFRLTPRALADVEAIAAYTLEQWGARQMADYLLALNRRFEWLAENPSAGRARNDVHPGYRSFPEQSHVIFYVVSEEHVDIIGVPHKTMDVRPGVL